MREFLIEGTNRLVNDAGDFVGLWLDIFHNGRLRRIAIGATNLDGVRVTGDLSDNPIRNVLADAASSDIFAFSGSAIADRGTIDRYQPGTLIYRDLSNGGGNNYSTFKWLLSTLYEQR